MNRGCRARHRRRAADRTSVTPLLNQFVFSEKKLALTFRIQGRGAFVRWLLSNVLGSRKIELDDERSGLTNGLTASQRDLLDREGNINKLEASYTWIPSPHHIIQPSIAWIDHDLNGDAMAKDGYTAKVSYAYLGLNNIEFLFNFLVGTIESDTYNPIFTEKEEVDRLARLR